MYRVNFHSYCGMSGIPEDFDSREDARSYAVERITNLRKLTKVTILKRGHKWEAHEPEVSHMIPDYAGILKLQHITFECQECGSQCETQEDAWRCCLESGDQFTEDDED